ncbi:MAG: DUF938 domain-containing protein, partial [Bdellovibrionales bacterium]|nr:DUF938 domain-containing protein [Bdellovibrionales bacterium]
PIHNLRGPLEYDITKHELPSGDFDVVFTANTIHIFSWDLTIKLFDQWAKHLNSGCKLLIYGAFNYEGKFTSESNERFEQWLKERDPQSGIRDFEKVRDELKLRGFDLVDDIEMPANNRMLVFNKNELVSN